MRRGNLTKYSIRVFSQNDVVTKTRPILLEAGLKIRKQTVQIYYTSLFCVLVSTMLTSQQTFQGGSSVRNAEEGTHRDLSHQKLPRMNQQVCDQQKSPGKHRSGCNLTAILGKARVCRGVITHPVKILLIPISPSSITAALFFQAAYALREETPATLSFAAGRISPVTAAPPGC